MISAIMDVKYHKAVLLLWLQICYGAYLNNYLCWQREKSEMATEQVNWKQMYIKTYKIIENNHLFVPVLIHSDW